MTYFFDEAEITQFNSCLFLDKHILRFNVSMEKAMTMDIVQRGCYLLNYVPDLFMGEWIVIEFAHLHHSV